MTVVYYFERSIRKKNGLHKYVHGYNKIVCFIAFHKVNSELPHNSSLVAEPLE